MHGLNTPLHQGQREFDFGAIQKMDVKINRRVGAIAQVRMSLIPFFITCVFTPLWLFYDKVKMYFLLR